MADKDFTFVEKPEGSDPAVYGNYLLTYGALRATSVLDMVTQVLAGLGPGDKIKSLTLVGHGGPGYMSVGTSNFFLTAPANQNVDGKYIDVGNLNNQNPLIQLRCKFAQGSTVHLQGCNVGANKEGAKLVYKLNKFLQCVDEVIAPSGVVSLLGSIGDNQVSKKGDTAPPKPISPYFFKRYKKNYK